MNPRKCHTTRVPLYLQTDSSSTESDRRRQSQLTSPGNRGGSVFPENPNAPTSPLSPEERSTLSALSRLSPTCQIGTSLYQNQDDEETPRATRFDPFHIPGNRQSLRSTDAFDPGDEHAERRKFIENSKDEHPALYESEDEETYRSMRMRDEKPYGPQALLDPDAWPSDVWKGENPDSCSEDTDDSVHTEFELDPPVGPESVRGHSFRPRHRQSRLVARAHRRGSSASGYRSESCSGSESGGTTGDDAGSVHTDFEEPKDGKPIIGLLHPSSRRKVPDAIEGWQTR